MATAEQRAAIERLRKVLAGDDPREWIDLEDVREADVSTADGMRFHAIYHLPLPIRFAVMDSRTGDMIRDDLGAVRTWRFLKCAEEEASRLNAAGAGVRLIPIMGPHPNLLDAVDAIGS